MESDKSLHATITSSIYQGERNADTLVFLIPQVYEEVNLSDCTLLLRYILPNGIGKSEQLEMDALPYKDYYQYRLKAKTRITSQYGSIQLWLTAINLEDDIVLKTGITNIVIKPSKNIVDYLSEEDKDQLDIITSDIERLKQEKADSLLYNSENMLLQLTSQNSPIGDIVDMKAMVNEDLIIIDDDNPDLSIMDDNQLILID